MKFCPPYFALRQAGRQAAIVTTVALCLGGAAGAIAVPNPDAAMVEARQEKSNPALNMLTYRHFDELFPTRPVAAGNRSTPLPRSALTLADDVSLHVGAHTTTVADYLSEARVNAMVVLKDGKLVREVYRNGSNANHRFIAFSMSKSMISMLFGMAIADHAIGGVDDMVVKYLPELKGSAYEGVRLRDLLTMRAGTSWKEDYAPGSDLARLRDMSQNLEQAFYESYATKVTRAVPPGTRFNYATLDTELLGVILSRATHRTIADLTTKQLWKPAGMEASAYWVMQGPAGRQHEFYGAGFAATARDYARVGQMMLDKGAVAGKQVVPRAWAVESTTSTVPKANYFYQWWGVRDMDGFSARGVYGQYILVDRPSRTVMVLLSYGSAADGPGRDTDQFFQAVVERLDVGR